MSESIPNVEVVSEGAESKEDLTDMNRAIRIISINDEGDKFELCEDNLKAVLKEVEILGLKKIVVISVVGAFRTGKSFLLDLFLRYLHHYDQNPDEQDDRAWISSQGKVLKEGNSKHGEDAAPGFLWRSGQDRTTTGIWMYGKPFVRELPDTKEKAAVLLMDTQGMFDFKTVKQLTAAIFGLSTLISSYQIYNVTKQIQEDKLQQLHYFTEFSRAALKEFGRARERAFAAKRKAEGNELAAENTEENDEEETQEHHSFQTLEFLVRDWQNFEDEEDTKQCLEEMPQALDHAMTAHVTDGGTREQIRAAFENIDCFLLPHPGVAMTRKKYDGSIDVIEDSFLNLLCVYVKRVFSEKLVNKKMYTRDLSASDLYRYIKAYSEVFRNGRLPQTMTLVEAISMTTNMCAKDDANTIYKDAMKVRCDGKEYLSDDELRTVHNEAMIQAFAHFDSLATFGNDNDIQKTRQQLIDAINEEFKTFKKENDFKMQRGLEKYIVPLLAAIGAFLLDWLSDWTCDSWSTTCQEFSKMFALCYYIITLILGWEIYKIYEAQGSAAAGLGMMSLGQATLETVKELQDKYYQKDGSSAPPPGSKVKSE